MGSNPTLSAKKFSFAKFQGWLIAFNEMKFRFTNFRVYQEAKDYCRFCRDVTERYIPKKDKGLTSQLERTLYSIVLNIAEGSADNSDAEFSRFLRISIRSVDETVAGFDLAALHRYIDEDLNQEIEDKAHTLVKQLSSLRNRLKQ